MENQILISVIVPVYNGGKFLEHCLNAILDSSYRSYELIVVDDGSTDSSAEIGRRKGAMVLRTQRRQSGPAAARNHGAQKARGDVLFFVDADVVVRRDTLARVAANFLEHSGTSAVFGSYDDDPAEQNHASQFKNLYHSFVHQQSSSEAATFWSGCGAIRRSAFNAVGGFDAEQYSKPSIEDIELGYRLRDRGHQIRLDKEIQVKHLKRWELVSLIRTDIFSRAVPWSKLLLRDRRVANDLNLKMSDRVCAALVGLAVATLLLAVLMPKLLLVIPVLLAVVFALNYKLYEFLFLRKGFGLVAVAFPLQLLYYLYSGITFVICWFAYRLRKKSDGFV